MNNLLQQQMINNDHKHYVSFNQQMIFFYPYSSTHITIHMIQLLEKMCVNIFSSIFCDSLTSCLL